MDLTDLKILKILQENARTNNAEIARRVDMAPSCILERIRKLEDKGVIRGYRTDIDPEALGLGLTAFILVKSIDGACMSDVGEVIASFPEVLEVHNIAGEDCYLVKIRTRDTKTLTELLRRRFREIEITVSTKTTIVLDTLKESTDIPIDIDG